MNRSPVNFSACLLLVAFIAVGANRAAGQDDVLPGISHQRLATAAQVAASPPTVAATGEAGRVLWGLRRLTTDQLMTATSRAISVTGRARRIDAVALPDELADVLELRRLYRIEVQTESKRLTVIASDAPAMWSRVGEKLDEPISIVGLRADGLENESAVVFAPRISWVPESVLGADSPWPMGWRLLGEVGFDCGLLSSVAARNKESLGPGEYQAFYGMLAATRQLNQAPAGESVRLADVLQDAKESVGHWMRLDLETARLLRVSVSDPEVREQLASDHYWQIDAFGSLPSNLQIELPAGESGGEPLTFQNRFPVSLVSIDLPEWLADRNDGRGLDGNAEVGRVDMRMVSRPIRVDAFFYRLWSYESEFASSAGGRQMAPLLIVADMTDRQMASSAGADVQWLGWLMAIAVLGAIVVTTLVTWRVSRNDAAIRAKRT